MNKNKIILVVITVALISGGGSFYAGVKYNQSKNPATNRAIGGFSNFAGNGASMGGQRGMRGMGGPNGGVIAGEIISNDDKSIVIKLPDGGSKIVFFSSSTSIMKTVSANSNDLALGEQITIIGNQNSDGSITAQTIQIRTATSTFFR